MSARGIQTSLHCDELPLLPVNWAGARERMSGEWWQFES